MGRYANFFTDNEEDFEYKFYFAVQNSSDITKFGGIPYLRFSEESILNNDEESEHLEDWYKLKSHLTENGCINNSDVTDEIADNYWFSMAEWNVKWSKSDISTVGNIIDSLCKDLGWENPIGNYDEDTIEKFINERAGSWDSAWKPDSKAQSIAKFHLGFIIFCMLQKADETLEVSYET